MRTILLLTFTALLSSHHAAAQSSKPVIGVTDVQTVAQNISCDGWDSYGGRNCNADLANGFRIMLETAIVKSNKMDVMERNQLAGIIGEQAMGEYGLTTAGGTVGGLTGIDYLVYGSITKFGVGGSQMGSTGGSLLGNAFDGALGAFGTSSLTTEMAVDVKVTDVSTGRIVLADAVEAEMEAAQSHSVGGFYIDDASGDPFADVQRVVAALMAEAIVTSRIPFKVIKVQDDGTLILNYGNVFLQPGDSLAMFEVGEQFVDPDTGEVLGSEETEIGRVEVTSSHAKFSKAMVVESTVLVSEGSVLRRVQRDTDQSNDSTQRVQSGKDW